MLGCFKSRSGKEVKLPLFIPVYRKGYSVDKIKTWAGKPNVEACMVNSFFLYKDRTLKEQFTDSFKLTDYVGGFSGLLCTDSGAFQGLSNKPIYLNNKKIVEFQNFIQSDIAAPVDLITPPWDKRTVAEAKLISTQKKNREALSYCTYSDLAGMQQGGRFFDLRQQSIRELHDMGIRYYGIGSLVPFFNKDHNLEFVKKVLTDARSAIGPHAAMHVYGAGDPLEIPFFYYFGANIFDSSSYAHYGNQGYYMTPYGAVKTIEDLKKTEYRCTCPECSAYSPEKVMSDSLLCASHNLWLIHSTIALLRSFEDLSQLGQYLSEIIQMHRKVFPTSQLHYSLLD